MVKEEGSDVEGVKESIDVVERETGVGRREPTGDRSIVLATFSSFLLQGFGSSDDFGSKIEGLEVANSFSVDSGSIVTLDVGDDEPTGDRGIKLVTSRSLVASGLDNMGFGVQVQALVVLEIGASQLDAVDSIDLVGESL